MDYATPIQRSWDRMTAILFRPFDFAKWCSLGFTAWLATLTEGGGGGGGGGSWRGWDADGIKKTAGQAGHAVGDFFREYAVILIPLIAVVILLAIVLAVVFTWLSSRGKFMFLDNVLRNRAEIADPWNRFRTQGNSLFLWSLAFGAVCLLAFVFVAGMGFLAVFPYIRTKSLLGLAIAGGATAVLLFLVLAVAAGYAGLFLFDFVIPMMHGRQLTVMQGWRRFAGLFKANAGFFLIYGLLRFAISAAIWGAAGIVMLAACCCCCIGLVFLIPYVGTVLLLPVHVFLRLLGPEFLPQVDPETPAAATHGEAVPPAFSPA